MKKGLRLAALFLAALMLVGFIVSSISYAQTEEWDKDVFAYGSGLNEDQIAETAKLLGIANMDSVNKISVSAEDLFKYLQMQGSDSSMISSIFVKKDEKGSGTEVIITTPENITQVSGYEYTNAAMTAGITDAKIYVGAVSKVTGTSALTGVYKAFEMNGEELDKERVNVANEELEIVNAIVKEHEDNQEFDVEKFNDVIVYIKEKLIENKEQTGEKAGENDIRTIINNGLIEYNLTNIVNQVNIDKLVVLFQNFQNSSAIDSNSLKEQLGKYTEKFLENSEGLKDKAKDIANEIQNKVNSEESKGFIQKVVDFFKTIIDKIIEIFNR